MSTQLHERMTAAKKRRDSLDDQLKAAEDEHNRLVSFACAAEDVAEKAREAEQVALERVRELNFQIRKNRELLWDICREYETS